MTCSTGYSTWNLTPDSIQSIYPNVAVRQMKRGLLIVVNKQLDEEHDPTVGLVVALNRRADDTLRIPDLDQERRDASHPEPHVELFTAGISALRRTRARVARLGVHTAGETNSDRASSTNRAGSGEIRLRSGDA